MSNWKELEEKYFLRTGGRRIKITVVKGEGAKVWDEDGNEYLDFVAGWAVNNLGHCHPVVVEAIKNQASNLISTSNDFYTIPQIQLAELLVQNSCLDRVFFSNSGAEANEGAIKLARKYGKIYLDGAYEVITTMHSFHGRTLAMVAATGKPEYQQPYTPMPQGFLNVEYNSIDDIRKATSSKTCAIMLELVQGEGGVNVSDREYIRELRMWCDERGILLILDEVQTGCGRLGTLFGYEQYGIEPDVMTLAKGLGCGVPIGAILAKEKASVFQPGDHGSTYGGNPLVCAAAYAAQKFIIENKVPGNAKKVGAYFKDALEGLRSKHPIIREVRGMGLLLATEFEADISADVAASCINRGLLVNQVTPNALRFMPPLIITEAEVDQAIGILDGSIAEVAASVKGQAAV